MQGQIKHGEIKIIQTTGILHSQQSDVKNILSTCSLHEVRLTQCEIYMFLHCLIFKNSSKWYSTNLVLSFMFR